MKQSSLRLGGPALLLGLLALLLAVGGASRASAADTNTIKGIATVTMPDITQVEITLTSTRQFDVRDDILTLQIGTTTFTLSRSPDDGSLNTVIFALTPAEFAATKTKDPVTVYFGSSSPTSADAWNFGTLDKSLLK